jgi:glycosyltransferase involved in cell wall biosynthesis
LNLPDSDLLMVIEDEIATTQLIERILRACGPLGVRYTKVRLADLTFGHLNSRTVPLFVRCGDPALPLWVKLLRRAKHPYLYYIDDNFWEIRGDSPVARYYREPAIRQSLEFAVTHAHRVLTNSEVLCSYLRRFSSRLSVLPPFFDFDLIEGCDREQSGEFRIGFAGSTTRSEDLQLIASVIQPVLDRLPNAVFEFCGVLPPGICSGPRVRFFGHTNSYAEFIRFQARRNWAIGLAPLRDIPANRAKTNNKYREYGACGIAGIYSDIPPYQGSVEPMSTGLLVEPSGDAWLSAITRLAVEPDLRKRIAGNSERDVRAKFCVKIVAGVWAECLREVHTELSRQPSHLTSAYLSGIFLERASRDISSLWLQTQDAYRIGGVPMVVRKTVKRVSLGVGSALGLRVSG